MTAFWKAARTALAWTPFLMVTVPWALLHALGARDFVVVITGMMPPGMTEGDVFVGLLYVALHLLGMVAAVPLGVGAAVYTLQR